MEVRITVTDDDGKVVLDHTADARHPTQARCPQESPVVLRENEAGRDTCVQWKLFGFTYSPMIDRQIVRRS